jgi:selenocysteine lyase/cysteine desulfurase
MLPSQRALFSMPRDVCYMNAAGWSPLPLKTQAAAREAVGRKGMPWTLPASFANEIHERTRKAAARLVNADPGDVALVSSIGFGVAIAGKVLALPRGSRVLVLENDHTSPVLEWMSRAEAQGFTVDAVKQPDDADWTRAVLETIERPGSPPVSLASISSVHWSDGGCLDLAAIGKALKQRGAAFLVDHTHGAGMLAMDVKSLDPDFVLFPTYKWLLGPYGRAFAYIAKRHQDGVPLEQTSFGRRDVRAENDVYFADARYLPDARRFDMGERDHFISMEMAAMGIELVTELGQPAMSERLAMLTDRIADGVRGLPVTVPERRLRAPHVLCLKFDRGMPAGLVAALAAEKIYVAPRLGRMRISPHVYNDEHDVDRLVTALRQRLG